jgi:hypothetical protein
MKRQVLLACLTLISPVAPLPTLQARVATPARKPVRAPRPTVLTLAFRRIETNSSPETLRQIAVALAATQNDLQPELKRHPGLAKPIDRAFDLLFERAMARAEALESKGTARQKRLRTLRDSLVAARRTTQEGDAALRRLAPG